MRDKLGKEKYVRGENNSDILSRELDEWVKEIKCTNAKGIKFEQCRDSSARVFEKEVIYGSHTYELNPNMMTERFSYKGGKDERKELHGNGSLEFANDGSMMSGNWEHGKREGYFNIETKRKGIISIEGEYSNDKMNGKVKIKFEDNTWLEGFFKDAVIHGF